MSYNKDTDYQAKIDEAVKSGDYESAAKYEQSRNEKIDGENLSYEKTNRYSGWLDTTDYSTVIKNQIASGASKNAVSDSLKKRITKSAGTDGLNQYAYDSVYDDAIKYIMGGNSFSYKTGEPKYRNSYESDIKALLRQLRSMKSFSYDPYEDDLYEYYKKQYNREGKRAMEDLLGELAANTGGIASSYAASAAAQSRDYYNQKLTDKIPELYNAAFDRYLEEIGIKERQAGLLGDMANDEYSRYLDSLEQYNLNREFDYNAFLDELETELRKSENERKAANEDREYELDLKKIEEEAEENSRNRSQQEYENLYNAEQDKIENALKKWNASGYLDKESAQILGLPEGLHTTDYDYKKAQQHKLYNK